MASVSTYLNFKNQTEEAFNYYAKVFGGELIGLQHFGDAPAGGNMSPVNDETKNLVMHVALSIMDGHMLMGTDASEAMGFKTLNMGNNVYISVNPDSKEEADRIFNALSEGGVVEMPMQDVFWGDYYGSLKDKFGVQWMVNYSKAATH